MSPQPGTITSPHAESALASTILTWDPLGWDPLIDHYRIYAADGGNGSDQPDEDDLVGKTVYPRFVHDGLDPAGETWTYQVIAVSDAGRRGEPGEPVTASSLASVTATGRPVATIGDFDGRTFEHRHAPAGYLRIPEEHPEALIEYDQGSDTPEEAWPYLLPGPGDAWAGARAYRARWRLTIEEPGTPHDLALWLVDTTRLGGTLTITVDGQHLADVDLPQGGTLGSREGDANAPNTTLLPSYHELELPPGLLSEGECEIEFHLAEGGWVAWDAIGVFARE